MFAHYFIARFSKWTIFYLNDVAQKRALSSSDSKAEEVKTKKKRREDKKRKPKRSNKKSKHRIRKEIKKYLDVDSGEDTEILLSDHEDKKAESGDKTEPEYPLLYRQNCMF